MMGFRLPGMVLLIIVMLWVYFGTIPWREQQLVQMINESESPENIYKRLPFSIDSSRAYIKKTLDQADADLDNLESKVLANIRIRPFFAESWLDLAQIKYAQGDKEGAIEYASKAEKLWPTTRHLLYLIGSFWVKIGEKERAVQTFGNYLSINPNDIQTVMTIVRLLEADRDQLVRQLFSAESIESGDRELLTERMLSYAIRHKDVALSISLWDNFKSDYIKNDKLVTHYCDYLINKNHVKQAMLVWAEYTQGSQSLGLFLNPGFESEIINGGFNWRFRNIKGVDWSIDKDIAYQGNNSLKLSFLGEENVAYYHTEQIIPVEAGVHYKVSAYWRGDGISTLSTPFIELSALHSEQKVIARSETKRGNWSWQRVDVDLKMPEDSSILRVRVRRRSTTALDKNIAGVLWLDEFKIEKQN